MGKGGKIIMRLALGAMVVWALFLCAPCRADVIPLRGVIAHERMFFDKAEFRLSGHQAVDLTIVIVICGQIRFQLGDGPVESGFVLHAMDSIFLTGAQAATFRGLSLIPDTEVRILYLDKDRTQANIQQP